MTTKAAIPAAQYLRMSTEMQKYSLDNQADVIAAYARKMGFRIVATYTDAGHSGLTLQARPSLKRLLNDVLGRDTRFQAILVYDVSRWGRFQDVDEAAHYEFLCRSSGINLHYCAEEFSNELTLPNVIFKAVKRTMAAEYSRELSAKVYQSMRRIAEAGHWAGSAPSYGFRRLYVSENGKPRQLMKYGEQKVLRSGHVKLVLGPRKEIRAIRLIYSLFLDKSMGPAEIIRELARRGIPYRGRQWSFFAVRRVLTDPRHAGILTWGRTETRLATSPRPVPINRWIVTRNAFPAIVSLRTYREAQAAYYQRYERKTDEQLLDALRQLRAKQGDLSTRIIDEAPETVSSETYRERFGTLERAYELIGYRPPLKQRLKKALRSKRRHLMLRNRLIRQLVTLSSGHVQRSKYLGYVTLIAERVDVLVSVCPMKRQKGRSYWYITPRERQSKTLTLLILLNESDDAIHAMHVFPRLTITRGGRVYPQSELLRRGIELRTLHQFYRAAADANRQVPEPEAPLLGVPQIASYIGRGEHVVRRWIREGMPGRRNGRCWTMDRDRARSWALENLHPYIHARDRLGRFVN